MALQCSARGGVCSTSAAQQRISAPALPHARPQSCSFKLPQLQGRQQRLQQGAFRRSTCIQAALTAEASSLEVTKMSPIGDRVLVQPVEEADTTSGGLIMTTSGTKQFHDALIGTVLAVGDEVKIEVAKGNTVLFTKMGSSDVPGPDGELHFVQERSILARLS